MSFTLFIFYSFKVSFYFENMIYSFQQFTASSLRYANSLQIHCDLHFPPTSTFRILFCSTHWIVPPSCFSLPTWHSILASFLFLLATPLFLCLYGDSVLQSEICSVSGSKHIVQRLSIHVLGVVMLFVQISPYLPLIL